MTERRRPPRRGRGQRPPNRSSAETVDEPNPYREDSTGGSPPSADDGSQSMEDTPSPTPSAGANQPDYTPDAPPVNMPSEERASPAETPPPVEQTNGTNVPPRQEYRGD